MIPGLSTTIFAPWSARNWSTAPHASWSKRMSDSAEYQRSSADGSSPSAGITPTATLLALVASGP